MLLRSILCGEVWNGFVLGKGKGVPILWESKMGWTSVMGLYLPLLPPPFSPSLPPSLPPSLTHPPIVHVRELPEFMPLFRRDRSNWPRCLLWHGWLLGLGLEEGGREGGGRGGGERGVLAGLIRWVSWLSGL